jgi:uncharacterized protein YdaU (DUF1376 family)
MSATPTTFVVSITMPKKPQAMMWYPQAFLSSPRVASMHISAQGGYRNILDAMWLSGGRLDEELLEGSSRMGKTLFRKYEKQLMGCLIPHPDGGWTNERLLAEYRRTVKAIEKKADGGRKSGRTRRSKHEDTSKSLRTDLEDTSKIQRKTETETETVGRSHSNECESSGAVAVFRDQNYDPHGDWLKFHRLASSIAPHRLDAMTRAAFPAAIHSADEAEKLFAGIEAWRQSREWGERIFHNWSRFLSERLYAAPPPKSVERTRSALAELEGL